MLADRNDSAIPQGSNSVKGWKWLALIELVLAVGFLEAAIWTNVPQIRLVSGILAGCMIFRCLFAYGRSPGLFRAQQVDENSVPAKGLLGFAKSIRNETIVILSLALGAIAGAVCYQIDIWSPNFEFVSNRSIFNWLTIKIPTVVVQQVLFQLIFVPTILFLTNSRGVTVFLSALIFAALHVPNPLLVLLTLFIGLVWFAISVDRPRVVALTISHLILAVVVANVAEEYVFDMRVGKVCFQKWPEIVTGKTDQRTLVVYPRTMNGELQKVAQYGNRIQLSGKVYDKIRNKVPHRVHLILGSFDPEDTRGTSWTPLWINTVSPDKISGKFEFVLDSRNVSGAYEVRIFGQHLHGWSYPLHGSARIQIEPDDASGEWVSLYPKRIHGNIGHVRNRRNRTDLIGWGFSRIKSQGIDSLIVVRDAKLVELPLERRERKEIAEYYENTRLLNCGFISKAPFELDPDQAAVYVRNQFGELEKVDMELVNPAGVRMADKNETKIR